MFVHRSEGIRPNFRSILDTFGTYFNLITPSCSTENSLRQHDGAHTMPFPSRCVILFTHSMMLSSVATTLRAWEPKNAPKKWLVVNTTFCTWSFVLLLIVVFETDDSVGKRLAKAQYLVYDLLTTFVWVFQTSLTAVFDYDVTSLEQWTEFAVSLYFLGDSAMTLYKWKLQKEHTTMMGISVLVNFLAYFFVTMTSIRDLKRRRQVADERGDDGFLPVEPPTEKTPLSEKSGAV